MLNETFSFGRDHVKRIRNIIFVREGQDFTCSTIVFCILRYKPDHVMLLMFHQNIGGHR